MINKRTWEEFRGVGLLWWINTILHAFGWAIVYDFDDDGQLKNVYPARVKFRGFSDKDVENGYIQISHYLKENASDLYQESCE